GGEPLMYDLNALTAALHKKNIKTHLETSGAYPLSGDWDWICFSPKKFKTPLPSVAQKAHELKVVIYNKSDFIWAEQHSKTVNAECKLLLQPEWSKRVEIMPLIIEYAKQNPVWEISLQLHKYMDIP
ncbi:MAG: 7-carboxy-7-deazaguanine synthase QueE, partial [Chitinophagales bacterium]